MKKIFFVLFCMMIQAVSGQEAEVKKTIETFFTAFHAQDTLKLRSVFANEIAMHSITERKGSAQLSVETADDMIKSIAEIPKNVKFEERLLSWKIDVDGNMAHVWTPYEFYINGKMSHSGVDSFSLYKDNGTWKIIYCVDTRRK